MALASPPDEGRGTVRRAPTWHPLRDVGVIAILRGEAATHVLPVANALAAGGLSMLEVSLTTPGALGAITGLRKEFPHLSVGAGTVRTGLDVTAALGAGAQFLISPTSTPELAEAVRAHAAIWIAGAATPTEIEGAWGMGATAVKLFPIQQLGGLAYVEALRAPLPEIPFVPTGGIDFPDLGLYLRSGAVAVGLGSPLIRDALTGGSLNDLKARAAAAFRIVTDFRSEVGG